MISQPNKYNFLPYVYPSCILSVNSNCYNCLSNCSHTVIWVTSKLVLLLQVLSAFMLQKTKFKYLCLFNIVTCCQHPESVLFSLNLNLPSTSLCVYLDFLWDLDKTTRMRCSCLKAILLSCKEQSGDQNKSTLTKTMNIIPNVSTSCDLKKLNKTIENKCESGQFSIR